MRFCENCGQRMEDDTLACPACGTPVGMKDGPGDHGQQDVYTQANDYRKASGYDQQSNYGQQSGNGRQDNYSQQGGYDQQGDSGRQDNYSQQGGYDQQGNYSQQGSYGQQSGNSQQDSNSQQDGSSQQGSYTQQGGYGQQSNSSQPYSYRPRPDVYNEIRDSYHEQDGSYDIPTVGDWLVTQFLLSLPFVGIVMGIIWAVSSDTPKAKQNYARAWLIFSIIITIVLMVLGNLFIARFAGGRTFTYYGDII